MLTWPAAGPAAAPRGRIRPDLVYLGWQQAGARPDPGPPPEPPGRPDPDRVSRDWIAAQLREHQRLLRPARRAAAVSAVVAGAAAGFLLARPAGALTGRVLVLVIIIVVAATGTGMSCLRSWWQAGRRLAGQLDAEERRVAAFRAVQDRELADRQARYARQLRAWKLASAAFRRQPQWHPVTLPTDLHRIDIAGGTLAGWSALVTMIAAPRLAAGGEVTVLDLTEGGVAADLIAVARQTGINPIVRVLPADLAQLRLGADFTPELRAEVLAWTVRAAAGPAADGQAGAGPAGADPARDSALLGRLLRVLGPDPTMARLLAGLRVLGQLGDPADASPADLGGLTAGHLTAVARLAGRGAGPLVIEQAWSIEARLAPLAALGMARPVRPASRLKVAWLDRRAAATGNASIAAYLAVALTAVLRQAPPSRRWQHTVVLLGAERLPGEVLDRLSDAAEISGAGLVLGYRTIGPHVSVRLGRGDAAVGFMRLGNAQDARIAAEQIGTEHRFEISQLTDTVGRSLTDTIGVSYTSTVGTADSVTGTSSVTSTEGCSSGRSQPGPFAPLAGLTAAASRDRSTSAAYCDSRSITAGISAGTSWGWSTSRAVSASDSLASTAQRSRESLVEQHELQQLPHSAVLLCYPAPGGRQVLLADANPAIMALPTATLAGPGPPERSAKM